MCNFKVRYSSCGKWGRKPAEVGENDFEVGTERVE